MSKTRTFLGVAARDDVAEQARAAIETLRCVANKVKWVEPRNLHWTLHFLGEIDDQEVFEVCQAAERAAGSIDAFGLEARGVGAFPTNARPRTLWVGAGKGAAEMIALHTALDTELKPLGFRGESRKFVPHLTLGRAGRGLTPAESTALTEAIEQLDDFDAGIQSVDEVLVYASRLRREGSEYHVMGRAALC
ncbi:MAG: RNA 2',3'-cyclic phosphodiesterase [Aeoliella sp.]